MLVIPIIRITLALKHVHALQDSSNQELHAPLALFLVQHVPQTRPHAPTVVRIIRSAETPVTAHQHTMTAVPHAPAASFPVPLVALQRPTVQGALQIILSAQVFAPVPQQGSI